MAVSAKECSLGVILSVALLCLPDAYLILDHQERASRSRLAPSLDCAAKIAAVTSCSVASELSVVLISLEKSTNSGAVACLIGFRDFAMSRERG